MIKLIKEHKVTESVTTQIIYKEAKIDLKYINDSNEKNYGNGLFVSNSEPDTKPVYHNKYKCIERGVREFSVRILTEGLVAKNDWYINYQGTGSYYDPNKDFLTRFKEDSLPLIMRSKVVGLNKEGYDNLPFITEEQISKIVNIMNSLEKDKKLPTLAIPMRLITINGKFSSETIIANDDGSFPFLTMKDYTITKELNEPTEE
jgi:hypothetical protein